MKISGTIFSVLVIVVLLGQVQGGGNNNNGNGGGPNNDNNNSNSTNNGVGPGSNNGNNSTNNGQGQGSSNGQGQGSNNGEANLGQNYANPSCDSGNFPHGSDRWFWMEMEFHSHSCCHPDHPPTEQEIEDMLVGMSAFFLTRIQTVQEGMNQDMNVPAPTTISDLSLELADYDTCVFPLNFTNDPDFWCNVTLDITYDEPVFAPGVLPPGVDIDIWDLFVDATMTYHLESLITDYLWQIVVPTLEIVFTHGGIDYNQWNLVETVGFGSDPCDPERSGDNPGHKATLTWEQQQAMAAAHEDQEIEDVLVSSSPWSSTTVTMPLGMILTTAWMVGNWFF